MEAKVLACSHQADISIVTVEDDKFWENAIELPLGDTPRLQQHIDVVGFPMGGDGISITSGVVSRVDWGLYSHGLSSNLIVTVDAAINSGNSGGPAISDGKVVGVAFQGLSEGVSEMNFRGGLWGSDRDPRPAFSSPPSCTFLS